MGCTSSKNKRCRHCQGGNSPVVAPQRNSIHVLHQAEHKGDSYHMVALTSSTLGSLKLSPNLTCHTQNTTDLKKNYYFDANKIISNRYDVITNLDGDAEKKNAADQKPVKNFDLQEKLMEAKVWSSMMNEKIPKLVPRTPTKTPPGEPETINTWELMEGLEDVSPLRSPNHLKSFSFDATVHSPTGVSFDLSESRFQEETETVKPMWLQMQGTDGESGCKIADFDPEIISSFRKSLQDLPNDHPFSIRVPEIETKPDMDLFDDEEEEEDDEAESSIDSDYRRPSFSKTKVILYFTSLRGIRKTYEDCCHVRVILKGIGVRVDERDVSMHSGFKDELKELLGERLSGGGGGGFDLPRVFLGKQCIGGAEEIRRLNEDGKLEKLLEGCGMLEDGVGGGGYECEACGDIRFMPCDTCNGSCKVYHEFDQEEGEEEQGGEEGGEEGENGFQRCPNCNENGLIRCPYCCD